MQNNKAATVAEYLDALPPDRRAIVAAVRRVFLDNLPKGYEEAMQYGMIGYYIPHSIYPPGYHCDPTQPLPFAGLAAQKNHYGLYLMCLYGSPQHLAWFQKAWTGAGKKLDMGKACVRFKKLDDVPMDVLAEAIRRVPVGEAIRLYEDAILTMNKAAAAKRGKAAPAAKASSKPASRNKAKPAPAAKKSAKRTTAKAGKKVAKKASKKTGKKKTAKTARARA